VDVAFEVLPLEGAGTRLLLAAPAPTAVEWGQSVSLLRALFAQGRIGFTVLDLDFKLLRTNITPEFFGGPAMVPGSGLETVLFAEDADLIKAELRQVMDTGVPVVASPRQVRSLQLGGLPWSMSLSAFRLEDAQGRPSGVAVVVNDTSEQERVRRHRDLLHQAATRIGISLDVVRTAQALAEVVVSGFADYATVDVPAPVLDGNEPTMSFGRPEDFLRRIAVAAAAGPWPATLLQVGENYPTLPDNEELRRVQHGHPLVLDRREIDRLLDHSPLDKLLVPDDVHAVLVSPLTARGLTLGAVAAWRSARQGPFDEADVMLLSEISSRAALGIDNARRYTREHRAAVTLQQRLLPRATTDTTAAETTGIYRPASGEVGLGGDWFDVIPLPSLRIAFVVGDVIGHGLAAAAAMGRLRTAIQTFADLEQEPEEVLSHVENLVQRLAAEAPAGQRDTVGATCLYAVYDPTDGRCTLASAGMPPPLLVLPDGSTELVDVSPGPPLGVGGMPFTSTTIDLPPGSVLALYTDGMLGLDDIDAAGGLRRLRSVLAAEYRPGRPLDEIGRALLAGAHDLPPRDDIALLLARTRAVPAGNIASWQFPAEAESVAKAREVASRQLAGWGLDEVAFTTELVVSELVTNAIRYAGGPVGLRLIRDKVLICEVTDPSNTQPRLLRAATLDEGGRGLFIVAQCTSRWGCRYGRQGKTIWTEQPLS
jgi:serine phosphatase RsbU (regulator of sigma subunit)/anti-sigma regulatory factor (Ser/Thr protein kinase)